MKKVSIVVPMYNEEAMVPLFFQRIKAVIDPLSSYQFELIAVNDGSSDQTLTLLQAEMKKEPRLRVVNLTRNFGHEPAVAAGLKVATGDAVIPIDADLQDPPEIIPEMLMRWEEGYKVVNARRASRKEDSMMKRYTAAKFYAYMQKLAGKVKVPANVGHYRLIDRVVVDQVNQLTESNRVFRVEVPYVGYPTTEVLFARAKREKGKSHYNYRSMFDLAINAIISSSIKPVYWGLKLAIFFGAITALSSVTQLTLFFINVFDHALLAGINHPLWFIINIILVISTLVFVMLGVISIYVGKTFVEAQNRPFFLIERIYEDE
ncbi:MAG: glycosyltransferase family 2 protein [Bacilli bacterium]